MIQHTMKKLMAAIIPTGLVMALSIAAPAARDFKAGARVPRVIAGSQDNNVYTIKEAGLQFEIPKGWKAEADNNVVLSAEDGALTVTFIVEDQYKNVVTGIKDGLKERLTNMKSDGAPKEDVHNGMVHITESGTGSLKDTPIIWSIDVLKAQKTVTILTFGIQKVMEAHSDDYAKFVGSIRKL